MASDIFERAASAGRSTIVFGNLGQFPDLIEYYSRDYIDEDDISYLDGQPISVWIEPTFGTTLLPYDRHIILTSHLDLNWYSTPHIVQYYVSLPQKFKNSTTTTTPWNEHESYLELLRNENYFVPVDHRVLLSKSLSNSFVNCISNGIRDLKMLKQFYLPWNTEEDYWEKHYEKMDRKMNQMQKRKLKSKKFFFKKENTFPKLYLKK